MSRIFIESFFPATISKLHTTFDSFLHNKHIDINSYNIISILFPNNDMTNGIESCRSEISVAISIQHSLDDNYYDDLHAVPTIITIRNPVLCFFAIFGAIFGLHISLLDDNLGLLLLSRNPRRNQTHILYWSLAFLFFGFMNIAAIPLHCVVPMKNDTLDGIMYHRIPLPQQYPFFWMMDTCCTGIFSTLLIAALHTSRTVTNDEVSTIWQRYSYIIFIFLCGCTATCRFLIYDSSIELELWYILPVLLAALLFAYELISSKSHHLLLNQSRMLLYYYLIALVLLFCGIIVDPSSCRWNIQMHNHQQQNNKILLPWWWDFTRLPAIAFGACDLVFVGLYYHLKLCFSYKSTKGGKIK